MKSITEISAALDQAERCAGNRFKGSLETNLGLLKVEIRWSALTKEESVEIATRTLSRSTHLVLVSQREDEDADDCFMDNLAEYLEWAESEGYTYRVRGDRWWRTPLAWLFVWCAKIQLRYPWLREN